MCILSLSIMQYLEFVFMDLARSTNSLNLLNTFFFSFSKYPDG